jgi:outer membrane protein assembly factor BamD (BamD/ComL family)
MRVRCLFIALIILIGALTGSQTAEAQMGFSLDVKKPEPYDNRVLKAEKTPTDKPIKAPKRFLQNMVTHYNYFFNANNKLNEVIERAKASHKDDYASLLPFYNYSLDATAQDIQQLDSVIYKAQTGIVMHDLRNDWIDNLYMLWGASWYFQKKFDSASLMFQFINYAFAEKEKDGYYRYIGSRMDGNNALSVSTKEKTSLASRIFSTAPSRNEAFLWQIRSLIEQEDFTESGSLIATLRNDPVFPRRLDTELEEVQAYWFYRQGIWDSAATHLLKALDQATTKQERGRWEYLAAQLMERKGRKAEAKELYAKALAHGTDPVMDVYARLNIVRNNTEGGENVIEENIAALVKMARRPKYEEYRDVIYYMAAQMEMERNNLAAAQEYMMKAARYNNGNLASRSSAFLLIGDLAYDQRRYVQAASFYDSVQTGELSDEVVKRLARRQRPLAKVVIEEGILARHDSLQRIAALPEDERKTYITRLVRQLRKQQGLDDESSAVTSGSRGALVNNTPTDLFSTGGKGEWYFYNDGLKSSGFTQFRQTWGNRPNSDNWRRFAQVTKQTATRPGDNAGNTKGGAPTAGTDADNSPSFAALEARLPLTAEGLQLSNDSINLSLRNLGAIYVHEMEDFRSAIEVLEKLRSRTNNIERMDEVLFNLYFAYTKTGDLAKAAAMKALLEKDYRASRYAAIVLTGKDPDASPAANPEATRTYEQIYDMFLEGRFTEALAAKRAADSTYRTNRWQPQLLYIEAVYHIRQREDSTARSVLQTLVSQNNGTPIASKAQNLLDVLSRRQQIEDELSRLQIERPVDSSGAVAVTQPLPEPPRATPPVVVDPPVTKKDTVKTVPPVMKVPEPVAKPTPPPVRTDSVARKQTTAPPKKDTVAVKPPPAPRRDTVAAKPQPKPGTYYFDPALPHAAILVLNKVDVVFSNEARNALSRYNRERFSGRELPITVMELSPEVKLLIISGFTNGQEALDYTMQVKRLAPTEIMPWLKADKYSFSILGNNNKALFEEKKKLDEYKEFLNKHLPGLF